MWFAEIKFLDLIRLSRAAERILGFGFICCLSSSNSQDNSWQDTRLYSVMSCLRCGISWRISLHHSLSSPFVASIGRFPARTCLLKSDCPALLWANNEFYERVHPTPRIGLFIRPSVRPFVRHEKIPHHRYMHQGQRSWIYASFIPASYTHASGSRIIGICIIHTCIRVKDRGS